jgi:hypothetical protein
LYECHRAPNDTAGGPEGCGRPVNDGDALFQDLVRSRVKRLLSAEQSVNYTVADLGSMVHTPRITRLPGFRCCLSTIDVDSAIDIGNYTNMSTQPESCGGSNIP